MHADLLDFYYRIMWAEFQGTDALYEEHNIHMIGTVGLNAMHGKGLLESCGVVDGRRLYTLCPASTLKGRLSE